MKKTEKGTGVSQKELEELKYGEQREKFENDKRWSFFEKIIPMVAEEISMLYDITKGDTILFTACLHGCLKKWERIIGSWAQEERHKYTILFSHEFLPVFAKTEQSSVLSLTRFSIKLLRLGTVEVIDEIFWPVKLSAAPILIEALKQRALSK